MIEDDPIMAGLFCTALAIYVYVMFLLLQQEWPSIEKFIKRKK